MLRVVADTLIPDAEAAFGALGPVRVLPAAHLTRDALAGADVLLVRSVTRITPDLVAGTPVRFVGTATAGTDHLDLAGLARAGVATAHAPGSNADSVVDAVVATLLALASDRGETLAGRTLGVVGAGAVGGRLVPRARALGMRVAVCDPPRAAAGHLDHDYLPLDDVLAASDILSLHVPLAEPAPAQAGDGLCPTRDLIGADALARLPDGAWLVNAARGEVVDGAALMAARPRLGALVLDCLPGEPAPDPALVAATDLASPHVAGHAVEAKARGTAMLAAAVRAWAEGQGEAPAAPYVPRPATPQIVTAPAAGDATAILDALARQACDVRAEDARFRAAMDRASPAERAAAFADLRRSYPRRREMASCVVAGDVPAEMRDAVTGGLGMRLG